MQYYSIWEDAYYITSGYTDYIYNLYDENTTLIYTGRAVAKPGNGACEINISRIVQNYLNSKLPNSAFNGPDFNTGQVFEPDAVHTFTLTDEKGTELEQYKFINCWDYKTPFSFFATSSMNYPLSKPANNHKTVGMYDFASVFTKNERKVRTTISNASGDTCGFGALYYSNSIGGYDAFLIEGNITKKDTYDRYTIENRWQTNTLYPGTRTLVNTIDESWTLNTHLLTDSEAKVLAENLYGSNNIYFHSFADDTITPVIITDTSVDYKNWRNQKRKRFYLTINIKSTQPKQRI